MNQYMWLGYATTTVWINPLIKINPTYEPIHATMATVQINSLLQINPIYVATTTIQNNFSFKIVLYEPTYVTTVRLVFSLNTYFK